MQSSTYVNMIIPFFIKTQGSALESTKPRLSSPFFRQLYQLAELGSSQHKLDLSSITYALLLIPSPISIPGGISMNTGTSKSAWGNASTKSKA